MRRECGCVFPEIFPRFSSRNMIPAAASRWIRKENKPTFNVMWKCVVSGCPSRMGSLNRGALKRGPKRFFRFPTSADRVKVWLAAVRETDKDPSEQHFICEDHFLPEDISGNDVRSDAIPIMPPYLDGPQFPTSADPLLEEEQWASGGWGDEEEEDEDEAPEQNPTRPAQNPSEPDVKSEFCPQDETTNWFIREGTPLTRLTRGFLQLLMADPDAWLDVREVAEKLQTHTHRVQIIVDVLQGVGLVQSDSDERVRWIGSSPIFSFLWRDTLTFLTMLQELKVMEEEVDRLFKSCAQQLFDLTEDEENSSLAYVRCDDICRLGNLQHQTVIVIRSPPETKLIIPPPDEDGIRMQLKSENGPIVALTCDLGTLTSELTNMSVAFSALESRVRECTVDEVVNKKMKI